MRCGNFRRRQLTTASPTLSVMSRVADSTGAKVPPWANADKGVYGPEYQDQSTSPAGQSTDLGYSDWLALPYTQTLVQQVIDLSGKVASLTSAATPTQQNPSDADILNSIAANYHAAPAAPSAQPAPATPGPKQRHPERSVAEMQEFTELEDATGGVFAAGAIAPAPAAPVAPADDLAVDSLAAAMKAKLADARAKGRSGWQTCRPEVLSEMLRDHVEKGDPRDVANFCAFLWSLSSGITAPLPGSEAFDRWVGSGMGLQPAPAAPGDSVFSLVEVLEHIRDDCVPDDMTPGEYACATLNSLLASGKTPSLAAAVVPPSPYSLTDFNKDQWWARELDSITALSVGQLFHVTSDLKRAIAVVHALLTTLGLQPSSRSPTA